MMAMHKHRQAGRGAYGEGQRQAAKRSHGAGRALGWFSIGLGLAQVVALPGAVARLRRQR